MAASSIIAAAAGGGRAGAAGARRAAAVVTDPLFVEHWLEEGHPESPARYRAVIAGLEQGGLLAKTAALAPATDVDPAVLAVHTQEHLRQIRGLYGRSHEVALRAVGAGIAGVRAVCDGGAARVFCATRPPGHHALNTGREEGFCFYNTVAIAARYAQKQYGLGKILIVDWDYHHGNGTEAAFYEDPSVLFFSTHDARAYPGTGSPARKARAGGGAITSMSIWTAARKTPTSSPPSSAFCCRRRTASGPTWCWCRRGLTAARTICSAALTSPTTASRA